MPGKDKSDLRGLAEFDQARRPSEEPETTIEAIGMVDEKFDGTVEKLAFWRCSHCGNSGTSKPDEAPKTCPRCDPGCYPGAKAKK
jgi:rubrerythrin